MKLTNNEVCLRKKVQQTLEEIQDKDERPKRIDRPAMVEAIGRRTGQPPREVERILRELELGKSNQGIQAHSPASGSSGVENAG